MYTPECLAHDRTKDVNELARYEEPAKAHGFDVVGAAVQEHDRLPKEVESPHRRTQHMLSTLFLLECMQCQYYGMMTRQDKSFFLLLMKLLLQLMG